MVVTLTPITYVLAWMRAVKDSAPVIPGVLCSIRAAYSWVSYRGALNHVASGIIREFIQKFRTILGGYAIIPMQLFEFITKMYNINKLGIFNCIQLIYILLVFTLLVYIYVSR